MDARNMCPWDHPQSTDYPTRSKAAAFITALAEARAYAAAGALPSAFADPALEAAGSSGELEGGEGKPGSATRKLKVGLRGLREDGGAGSGLGSEQQVGIIYP